MIFGDQWTCEACTWSNLVLRKSCRNCGKPRPAQAPVQPALRVVCKIQAIGLVKAQQQKTTHN